MKNIIALILLSFVLCMPVYAEADYDEYEKAEVTEQRAESSMGGDIAISIIGGFVISLLGCYIYLGSNKTLVKAQNAATYIKNAKVDVKQDIFLYRSETRRERPKENK